MGELGAKVCAGCVRRHLTNAHKQTRLEACLELLECHEGDETFFKLIVTEDETWAHHYKPESKRAFMKWRYPSSPRAKKFNTLHSGGKVMATVFCDVEGVILVNCIPQITTINSDAYVGSLRKLKARLKRVRSNLKMSKLLLQHDNTRPHIGLKTRQVFTSFG